MRFLMRFLRAFWKNERAGLEPVEIAVILFLIVLACLAGVTLLGNKSSTKANTASGMLQTANGG